MINQEALLTIGNPSYFDKRACEPYVNGLRWPHNDNSIDRAAITHTLEYIPGPERIYFINELWRVLKPDAKATLWLPFWSSPNSHADPYLVWPPISEMSIQYLADAEFRKRNNIEYSELIAKFYINWGHEYAPEWHIRSDQTRATATKHWLSIVRELVCSLQKLE